MLFYLIQDHNFLFQDFLLGKTTSQNLSTNPEDVTEFAYGNLISKPDFKLAHFLGQTESEEMETCKNVHFLHREFKTKTKRERYSPQSKLAFLRPPDMEDSGVLERRFNFKKMAMLTALEAEIGKMTQAIKTVFQEFEKDGPCKLPRSN